MWGDLWRRKREEGSQKNKKINKKRRRRRREKRENLKKCVGIGKAKEALGGWEKFKIEVKIYMCIYIWDKNVEL